MKSRKWLWIGAVVLCAVALCFTLARRRPDEYAFLRGFHPAESWSRDGSGKSILVFRFRDHFTDVGTALGVPELRGYRPPHGYGFIVLFSVDLPSGRSAILRMPSSTDAAAELDVEEEPPWPVRAWNAVVHRLGL
ncbi:MAG TPA: hypothetical protein VMI31_00970 [Fimbriimonadaceae bacterium]|nr:hypothetical protein [Fimbriimonadaceae bacterium]